MKIIDLLNKIANGEEPPKKIYYLEETFTYDEQSKDYYDSETYGLFDRYEIPPILNDEVEILETTITYKQDDKIIQLPIIQEDDLFDIRLTFNQNRRKINEIINKLNGE